MKTILVTGAAGFIGSNLCDRLLERGDTVAGVDNFNDYYDPAIKRANLETARRRERFHLYETDICEEEPLRAVFDETRPDVVVHLAARAGVRPSIADPNLYHRVNIIGSQHVLDACRDFKPQHLVFASSSSVYGGSLHVPFSEDNPVTRPVSPYAATKRMNELQAHVYHHLYGLKVTLHRFFTVYGPRQRPDMAIHKFTRLIASAKPVPMFGDGATARDYTYIDDVLDGLLKSIDKPFDYEIFNLGEHHTTELRQLITLIAKHVGKEAIIERMPPQPGDMTITYADIRKAKALLGYAPRVGIDEGLQKFVAWYRQTHGNATAL